MQQFITGLKHFIGATGFLARHRLLHYYLFPLFLSILFYIGITAFVLTFANNITDYLFHKLAIGQPIDTQNPPINTHQTPSFLSFFTNGFMQNIATFLVGLVVLFISAKFSKYLVLIILSPLFAYLSEVVEEKITGKIYPFNLTQFIKDILRGIIIALRNLMIELGLIGLFTIAGLFAGPFAVLIVPLLWLISAYFYGFSMMDYTCERRKMSIREGVEFIRQNRVLAVANGGLYALLDMIPFVGLTIGPINAVVGATTAILEVERLKSEQKL